MARRRYYAPMAPGRVFQFQIVGLDQLLDTMRAFPKELVSSRGGPIRYALQKAGKIMHVAARNAAPVKTGNLRDSIIQRRGTEAESGPHQEKQFIFVRRGGANRRSAYYASFQEFGTSKNKATPFMRPAFDQNRWEVIDEFAITLRRTVHRLARRYYRMNIRGGP